MSDLDEREFDIDSEFEDDEDGDSDASDESRQLCGQNYGNNGFEEDEDDVGSDGYIESQPRGTKRDHHNALERKRRDHIKGSYAKLREVIPSIQGTKASRAQTLEHTANHINKIANHLEKKEAAMKQIDEQIAEVRAKIKVADERLLARGLPIPEDDYSPGHSSEEEFSPEADSFVFLASGKRRKIQNMDTF